MVDYFRVRRGGGPKINRTLNLAREIEVIERCAVFLYKAFSH